MFRQILTALFFLIALTPAIASAAPPTETASEPAGPDDAEVDYVRGYVRWQAIGKSEWQKLKETQRVPLRGRVAISIGAALVLKTGNLNNTYVTGGIYELETGKRSTYVPIDTDPPGIRSMRPSKLETNIQQLTSGPVKVVSVRGSVQWRSGEDVPWLFAKFDDELPMTARIRTGLRSMIKVKHSNKTITIDRLGVWTIEDVFRRNGRAKTDIGLKYGRTHYKVQAADEEHESTVLAPSKTLARRGQHIRIAPGERYESPILPHVDFLKSESVEIVEPDLWYKNSVRLSITPTIDELVELVGVRTSEKQ